jgi:type IV secretory pathway VirB2 component (pilin)
MLFYNSVGIIYGQGYALDGGGGGNTAPLETVTSDIAQYIEPVRMLIYAIAAIVAIGGGISVYVKMNNEEQDVKKSIMMIVGACIFLIAAATALPAFFGYN